MNRVTFLNTSMNRVSRMYRGTRKLIQPLDVMYAINTFDPEQFQTQFIELCIENMHEYDISQEDVFVVCTTSSYLQWNNHFLSLQNVNQVLARLDELRPDKDYKLVMFGPHCVNHYEYLLERGVHAVIVGEAELTVAPVVNALLKGESLDSLVNVATPESLAQGRCPVPQQVDLSKLPTPNWQICRDYDYNAHNSPKVFERGFLYETSRGCPFQCSYCNTETHRRVYRTKPIEQIKRDLEIMVYEYGAEYVYFIDESFGYDSEWVEQLLPVLKELPVEWGCQGNIKYTTPEKLAKMAEAGCINMEFGLETFNADVLKQNRKVNDLDRASELLNSAIDVGISPVLFLLVGLPGETVETVMNTADFLTTLKPGFRFSTGVPTPYPNTEYYRIGIREGIIEEGQIDESLYLLSGMIGNQLCWDREQMDKFLAEFGPNVWGNARNVERFQKELEKCFTKILV